MISVIIPIYNRAHTIRRAVDSVLRQTYRDLELLLVDDGSTDDTLAICREYERQDSRVKVFHTDNRGVSAARNLALRHCAGQYVRFLDSDDELPENSLADLIAPFQNNEAVELVMGAMLGYGYETPPLSPQRVTQRDLLLHYMQPAFQSLYCSPTNKLYLRSVLEKASLAFDESLCFGEDEYFNFQYFGHISAIYLTPQVVYVVHHPPGEPGHLSGKENRHFDQRVRLSVMLLHTNEQLYARLGPEFARCAALLFMDDLWVSMHILSRRRDYPLFQAVLDRYDWPSLLADCPIQSLFWAYRFLYRCLMRQRRRRLFLFFYMLNRLYNPLANSIKLRLRPLVQRCKRSYDVPVEGAAP